MNGKPFLSFTAFVAALIFRTISFLILIIGIRIKLIHRELHFTEYRAGIVIITRLAILFGKAEVSRGKHKLDLTLHTDDREDADSNVYVVCTDIVNEASVES